MPAVSRLRRRGRA